MVDLITPIGPIRCMGILSLYIASSIDGYIATSEGSVDWLNNFSLNSNENGEGGEDYGYSEYYESVDALIIGRKTFEQVLSFGEYPYKGKPAYIFTRNPQLSSDLKDVTIIRENPIGFTKDLLDNKHEKIWLVGGAEVIMAFLRNKMIDEIILSIIPIILGNGIPLFHTIDRQLKFSLQSHKTFPNDLVQLHYIIDKP